MYLLCRKEKRSFIAAKKNHLPRNSYKTAYFAVRVLPVFLVLLFFSNGLLYAQATNYTPLYTSANFIKTIDLSRPVGETKGESNITATGGASYTIPLFTCPGTNGVQPSIALSYQSQGSSGIAGFGWNISGLSLISRAGKDMYHNGIVQPVKYTNEDAFILDGTRLNVIAGINGGDGSIYALESENFSKVISYTSVSASNPDWFEVTLKDGSVMEYGHTPDSRFLTDNSLHVMYWRLNKVKDIHGNYIEFKYNNGNRDSRLQQILYTGNTSAGLAPYNQVNFTYSVRSDANTGYESGASITSQYLLEKVVMVHTNDAGGTETVKTYKLNYGFNNTHSMLKEFVEFGGDETAAALNSTIFLYGDTPQDVVNNTTSALAGSYDYFPGDFDADGKTDFVQAQKYYDPNIGGFLHNSYSLLKDVNESSSTVMYIKSLPQSGTSVNNISSAALYNFMSADYDGDGRDDVLQVNSNNEQLNCGSIYRRSFNSLVLRFTKSFNNQTGYTDYTEQTLGYPTRFGLDYKMVSGKGNFIIPGDFDGDGNQDYILFLAKKRQSGTCNGQQPYYDFDYKGFMTSIATNDINQEILNFGFGTNTYGADYYAGTFANADLLNILDFDGDGKMEVIATTNTSTSVVAIQRISATSGYNFMATEVYTTGAITKDSKCFFGDFNSDRKTDILVRNSNGTWNILYSTGTGFNSVPFSFNQAVAFSNGSITDKILVADFNGDGRSDILHAFPVWVNGVSNSSKFSVYYGKGYGSTSFYYEQYPYNKILGAEFITGDFNGDGRTDFVNRINVFNSGSDFVAIRPFGKDLMLKKVTTGHNVTTTFDYKLLTDKSTYPYFYDRTVSLNNPSNQYPFNYVQFPVYALLATTVPDGIGGDNTTTYSYRDAVLHRAGKGFLGFRKVTAVNSVSGMTSETENAINTQFAVSYLVKQSTRLTATSELLSESTVNSTFVNMSTGFFDKRYFQKTDKTLDIDYVNDKASETVNTHDNYGNITQEVVKKGVLSGLTVSPTETATTITTFGTYNTPVPASPDNISVAVTRTGMATATNTTIFTYNTNGTVATRVGYSGLPKAVTTTYTYNNLGNINSTVVSASGLNSRTTITTFDPKGRYPVSIQKTGTGLSQTETMVMSSKWGQPLSKTSTDCLVTTNEYDAFGKLNHTILPDGTDITVSNSWHTQDIWGIPNTYKLFYTLTHYSGGKPDVKNYTDRFGRTWLQQTLSMYGPNARWHTVRTTFDNRGNIKTKTNRYFPNGPIVDEDPPPPYVQPVETPRITTYNYDAYNRPASIINDIGTTTYSYLKLGNGNLKTTVTSTAAQSSSRVTDPTGKVVSSIDNGGQMDFTFNSQGKQVAVSHSGTVLVTATYDDYARLTQQTDKDAGITTYSFDAFGQLIQQTDANGNAYSLTYDDFGRKLTRTGPEGTTSYEYFTDPVTGCSNNNISKETGFNGVVKEYTFDALSRMASEIVTVSGVQYTTAYQYSSFSQLVQTTYPSGLSVYNSYNANGYPVHTGLSSNPLFPKNRFFYNGWVDGEGRYLTYMNVDGKTTTKTYNKDFPASSSTPGVQNMLYNFETTTGNLLQRSDVIKNQTESFGYDNLNRLVSITTNNVLQQAVTYDGTGSVSTGNITTKTDAGYYKYRNDKIHALAYIMATPPPGQSPVTPTPVSQLQYGPIDVSYTPFLKPATIGNMALSGGPLLELTYGPDYQRIKSERWMGRMGLAETRYYLGSYEKQVGGGLNNFSREIHYVNNGNGVCGMVVIDGGVTTVYAVYTDHLGSINTITDRSGAIIFEQNFDAWGRNRNPDNWNDYGMLPDPPEWLFRGYTGHEMLPLFSLVNMNGRLYDPVNGRMLSPDKYIQEPYNTQNYNRYSYCVNNPLRYTDPTGDFFLGTIITAVVDFFRVGFTKGGFEFWNWGKSSFRSAWREFDPTRSGSRTNNAFKIDIGRFKTDPNRTFMGRVLQLFSRLTWEAPQTALGNLYSHVRNIQGAIDNVDYYGGATLVNGRTDNPRDRWGLTLGSYINGRNLSADPYRDEIFRHEYGHTLQSRLVGPFYITSVGIPSLLGSILDGMGLNDHNREWYETQANRMAFRYFSNHDPNAINGAAGGRDWNFTEYPTRYNPNWYWALSSPPLPFAWWLLF